MPFSEAAQQMACAYKNFINPPASLNLQIVTDRPTPFTAYAIAVEYWQAQQQKQKQQNSSLD